MKETQTKNPSCIPPGLSLSLTVRKARNVLKQGLVKSYAAQGKGPTVHLNEAAYETPAEPHVRLLGHRGVCGRPVFEGLVLRSVADANLVDRRQPISIVSMLERIWG